MPHSAVIALSIVVLLVPGGPSSTMSRPAATAASTRSSSDSRPTIRSATRARTSAMPRAGSSGCSISALSSLLRGAGVDRQGHAGDVPRLVGGQEEHRVADVPWLDPHDRQRVELLEPLADLLPGGVVEIGREQ